MASPRAPWRDPWRVYTTPPPPPRFCEHNLIVHFACPLRFAERFPGLRFDGEIRFVWKFLARAAVKDLELGLRRFEPLLDCIVVLENRGEAPLRSPGVDGVDSVEGQGRLAGARHTGDYSELIVGRGERNIF